MPPRERYVYVTIVQKPMSKWVAGLVVGFVDHFFVSKNIKKNAKSKRRVIPLPASCFTNVRNVELLWNVPNALPIYTFVKNGSALTAENIKMGNTIVIKNRLDLRSKSETRNLFSTISRRVKMTSFIVRQGTVRLALDAENVLKRNINV